MEKQTKNIITREEIEKKLRSDNRASLKVSTLAFLATALVGILWGVFSLSGWGFGGARPLAIAKASLVLAPPVHLQSNDLFFYPLLESFLEGVRGNLFSKKGSPAFFYKIISTHQDNTSSYRGG